METNGWNLNVVLSGFNQVLTSCDPFPARAAYTSTTWKGDASFVSPDGTYSVPIANNSTSYPWCAADGNAPTPGHSSATVYTSDTCDTPLPGFCRYNPGICGYGAVASLRIFWAYRTTGGEWLCPGPWPPYPYYQPGWVVEVVANGDPNYALPLAHDTIDRYVFDCFTLALVCETHYNNMAWTHGSVTIS